MFYSTQIKSVGYGGAYDVTGKWLAFIGYLPVKVGDTVFTDGNIIFGNATPRGAAMNFFLKHEEKGIPVLADDLRGYFTQNGLYKEYPIAGENWIVNAEIIYCHDTDDTEIIDAEIAIDEDDNEIGVYSVEKIVTSLGEFSDNNLYVIYKDSSTQEKISYASMFEENLQWHITKTIYEIQLFDTSEETADFMKQDDDIIKECELIIKNADDDEQIIKLSELMNSIEALTFNKVNIYIPDHEDENHIKSIATLRNFKINTDGSWVALIECEICAERIIFRQWQDLYADTDGYSHSRSKVSIDSYKGGETIPEVIQNLINYYSTAQYIVTSTTTYYVKETRISNGSDPCSTIAREHCLFKISSDGTIEQIFIFGDYVPLSLQDFTCELSDEYINTESDVGQFPSHSTGSVHLAYLGTTTETYATSGLGLMLGQPTKESTMHWIYYKYDFDIYDSHNWDDAPDYDNGVSEVAETFDFPVQDGYFAKFAYSDSQSWLLEGIYNENGDEILNVALDDDDVISWNISFLPLENGEYLIGNRNGNFYKVDQRGNVTESYSDFKNFRLRELKRIDVAKERS